MGLYREPQPLGTFVPGDPESGYYNDLTVEARKLGTPREALDGLRVLTAARERANPVTIAQVGLGAWTLGRDDRRWNAVAEAAADWLAAEIEHGGGRLLYLFPTRHTFVLDPPWCSAMAQGEAASLLVRVDAGRSDGSLAAAAAAAVEPLLAEDGVIVVSAPEGPVLQEYPTSPPAHVLNGWIFALWGLYDVAAADPAAHAVREAFTDGVDALARRLPRYRAWPGWSRYDLFPHPLPNVASPFYHRLHVAQLRALQTLAPRTEIEAELRRWSAGATSAARGGIGTLRKAAFRVVRPRTRLRAGVV